MLASTPSKKGTITPGDSKRQLETTSLVKANAATHLPPSNPSTALYTIDKTTQTVTAYILSVLSSPDLLDKDSDLEISSIPLTEEKLLVPTSARQGLSQPKLQRLRRQFVQLQRAMVGNAGQAGQFGNAYMSEPEVSGAYVRFLTSTFEGNA